MKKIKTIIIILLSLLLVYVNIIVWYSKLVNNIPFIEAKQQIQVNYIIDNEKYSNRAELKQKISKLVGVKFYIYKEKDIGVDGRTIVLFRYIEMQKDLPTSDYIIAFTHELCHIKYCSNNERYTMFNTFKELYNSEFRDYAILLVDNMQRSNYDESYNCLGQIEEYLDESL